MPVSHCPGTSSGSGSAGSIIFADSGISDDVCLSPDDLCGIRYRQV